MYESPIELVTAIQNTVEDDVYKAILKTDVKVNKEELLKALRYDRDQYDKGYMDGWTERQFGGCVYYDSGHCKKFTDDDITSWCVEGPCEYMRSSRAQTIRNMTDEELAAFLVYVNIPKQNVLQWLKEAADE